MLLCFCAQAKDWCGFGVRCGCDDSFLDFPGDAEVQGRLLMTLRRILKVKWQRSWRRPGKIVKLSWTASRRQGSSKKPKIWRRASEWKLKSWKSARFAIAAANLVTGRESAVRKGMVVEDLHRRQAKAVARDRKMQPAMWKWPRKMGKSILWHPWRLAWLCGRSCRVKSVQERVRESLWGATSFFSRFWSSQWWLWQDHHRQGDLPAALYTLLQDFQVKEAQLSLRSTTFDTAMATKRLPRLSLTYQLVWLESKEFCRRLWFRETPHCWFS